MGKKISLKGSFFSAQNWFYPISERFGAFLAIFRIFHFPKFFRAFWSEKWAKKNFSRKGSFFSAHNWFYPVSERFEGIFQNFQNLGHFWQFFNFFIFLKVFRVF